MFSDLAMSSIEACVPSNSCGKSVQVAVVKFGYEKNSIIEGLI